MVDIQQDSEDGQRRFVLQPNQAISWRATCYLFLSLLVVSGSIAIGLALMGFWLVLPFAGLELAAVAAGLYTVARRCQQREVILVDHESIRIERGRTAPEQSWLLAKAWAKVVLERCPKRWYPSRLLIRSHGQSVEIGGFLNEDERCRLAAELIRTLTEPAPGLRVPHGQA